MPRFYRWRPLLFAGDRVTVWGQMWDENMGSLTAISVKTAKPGRHADGDGLYVHLRASGSRAWPLRIQSDGRRRDIGLGSAATRTLAEAREQAHTYRKMARDGLDPVAERQRAKVVIPTFAVAAETCHDQMKGG